MTPRRQIPPGRKLLYYGGATLGVAGLVTFASVFFTAFKTEPEPPLSVRDLPGWGKDRGFGESMRSEMTRAFVGMGLMYLGGILANIGRRGAAGSGLVLDPQQARRDLEPWTRAAGGMADDALSEVELARKIGEGLGNPKPQVKVRCRKCQALCDEASKFCGQCGERI